MIELFYRNVTPLIDYGAPIMLFAYFKEVKVHAHSINDLGVSTSYWNFFLCNDIVG